MSKKHQKNRTNESSGGLGEQLKNASANSHLQVKGADGQLRFANAKHWQGDGIDHINIDFFAKTELGQLLEPSSRLRFNHSIFLNFETVLGCWYYLRSATEDDRFRSFVGKKLQQLAYDTPNKPVKHIKAMVMDSAYQRVKQHPRVAKMLFESDLPFDMYKITKQYVFQRHANYEWVVMGYNEIRRALQTNTEPNFSFLCDDPKNPPADIYESVRPVIPEGHQQRQQKNVGQHSRSDTPRQESTRPAKPDNKPRPTPKAATEPQKPAPKPVRTGVNSFTFDPKEGYCQLVPNFKANNASLFLNHFHRKMTINDVPIETGPLESGVRIPLLEISDVPALYDLGLINNDDVVRAGPIMDKTFQPGFGTNRVIRLDSLVIGQLEQAGDTARWSEASLANIPLITHILDKSFTKPDEEQTITREGEDSEEIVVKRTATVHKLLADITGVDKTQPWYVARLLRLRSEEEAEQFRFAILHIKLELRIRMNARPRLFVDGYVQLRGISDHPVDNKNKQDRLLEKIGMNEGGLMDNEAVPQIELAGYTFTLFRGLPREVGSNSNGNGGDVGQVASEGAETVARVSLNSDGEVTLEAKDDVTLDSPGMVASSGEDNQAVNTAVVQTLNDNVESSQDQAQLDAASQPEAETQQ